MQIVHILRGMNFSPQHVLKEGAYHKVQANGAGSFTRKSPAFKIMTKCAASGSRNV